MPRGLLVSATVMLGPLEKTFTLLVEEKSLLVKSTVVNCWVFQEQASEGSFKVHFVTLGSQKKSLRGMSAFPLFEVDLWTEEVEEKH